MEAAAEVAIVAVIAVVAEVIAVVIVVASALEVELFAWESVVVYVEVDLTMGAVTEETSVAKETVRTGGKAQME